MNRTGNIPWIALALALAGELPAAGQGASAAPSAGAPRLLTLDVPHLRNSMERMSLAWLIPAQVPDFRLKLERPAWESLADAEADPRFRGVEIRLPLEGLWVGYDAPGEGEDPRATLLLRRGF